jgi:hypothetical protein
MWGGFTGNSSLARAAELDRGINLQGPFLYTEGTGKRKK